MGALAELFDSSEALVLLCTGASAVLGLLHLWMARRPGDANAWAAVWCGLSCIFLAARGVQLTTADPAAALLAGKVALSIGPYLVWAIVGFGRNANGGTLSGAATRRLGYVSVAWTIAILGTPFFVEPEVTTRTDLFGRSHYSVHARWPTLLLGAYFVGALVWGLRRLRLEGQLEDAERRLLIAGFGAYAVLGVAAVLTSVGTLRIPAMAEFGPVIIAVCLCYLMVRRRARVETQLASLLAENETRLAATEERYRLLVERAPIGIVACDAEGRVTAINPRMRELARVPSNATPTVGQLGFDGLLDALRTTGGIVRDEFRPGSASPGPDQIWQLTATPVSETSGTQGALLLADDVTERRMLEEQLQQAQKMESIGQLAAGIAHEINNPMAFVRANLAAMRDLHRDLSLAQAGEPAKEAVLEELANLIDETAEGVERTISIARDMREVAYSGAQASANGASVPESELVPVLEACIRVATVSESRGVTIQPPSQERLSVAVASGPLRQVFLNLLINALQAVGEGGNVWIETRTVSRAVIVSVHDDGPGIPEALRGRLFDPFFTTKRVGEGTGLGLTISYQIVRGYGGEIRVLDSPHGGACFEVELPLAQGQAD